MSSSQYNKKENPKQNLFLTENLFTKNHLDLGFSRNSKFLQMSINETSYKLPKLMQKTSNPYGTFSQHKKSVLDNLLKLQDRLDEIDYSSENLKHLLSSENSNEKSPLKTVEQNFKTTVNNTFLKNFNEQLKKKKVYIIDNEQRFKFGNASIANAINDDKDEKKSPFIQEVMDLRFNNYNMVQYIENRYKTMRETNKQKKLVNSIDSQRVYSKSRSNNNVYNSLTKMPKLFDNLPYEILRNNDSFVKKVPYFYNDTVTDFYLNQINPEQVPHKPDIYKNINLNKVLTMEQRVIKPFKFK